MLSLRRTPSLHQLWLAPDLVLVEVFTILPMMTSVACLRFRTLPLYDWAPPTSYLVTIDFSEVLHVAEELCHSDSLRVTRCNLLPVLIGTEETAMFTFSRLIPVSELLRVTPGELNPILVTKYRAPGMFRSTLTSWIFDVTIAQATLSSCATIT